MIGILLLILKIILWIVLGILGLLVLLLLMILLVPIRYDALVSKCLVIKAKGQVSYLFGLIRILFDYNDGATSYKVKVLFFLL